MRKRKKYAAIAAILFAVSAYSYVQAEEPCESEYLFLDGGLNGSFQETDESVPAEDQAFSASAAEEESQGEETARESQAGQEEGDEAVYDAAGEDSQLFILTLPTTD